MNMVTTILILSMAIVYAIRRIWRHRKAKIIASYSSEFGGEG